MMTFDPPELKEQIADAIRAIEKVIGHADYLGDDLINPADPEFDPSEHDDLVITPDYEWDLWLPDTYESITMTYGSLLGLAEELKGAELIGGVEGWTPRRLLVRVYPMFGGESYTTLEAWLDNAGPEGTLVQQVRANGVDLTCSFHRGNTLFGLMVVAFGYYDKHFPPTTADEFFVEVLAEGLTDRSLMRAAADAYIFELAASLRLDCRRSPRLDSDDLFPEDEPPLDTSTPPTLRPLLLGPGLDAVIAIYNTAVAAQDPSFEILGFVKVIEHISQTVIRLQMTDAVRGKLASPRALNPDAAFVLELENLVAEQRAMRKDREALRATVQTCCEVTELKKDAPPFLVRLRSLDSADEKQRRAGLDELAGVLTATRNSIAHAKAGYITTGEECPPDQLGLLASCARLAAEQAIRWYAARHESSRVI